MHDSAIPAKEEPSATRILLVEDDPQLAAIAHQGLSGLGYQVIGPYTSGESVLESLPALDPKPDLVLMDINLAGTLDGIQTAEVIHREFGLAVVYASALHDDPTLKRATKAEPFGYVVKPYRLNELHAAIEMALYKRGRDRERQEILEQTVGGSIQMLCEILSVIEAGSFGRGQRLKECMQMLATALAFRSAWELEAAASLAQIGYVMVPTPVLQKFHAGLPLNSVESSFVMRTPEFGSELLKRIPRLESVAQMVLYQNKNFDGTGFPRDDVAGDKIPLGARMLKVLGDFLEWSRRGETKARIIEYMRDAEGQYDPHVLDQAIVSVIDAPPKGAQAVNLDELTVGRSLKAAVETKDGTLLVAAGTQVTAVVLKRLHNFMEVSGIKEPIYVESCP
jgi:response regulator RpfG family c-di-GMP phosphodiesterase